MTIHRVRTTDTIARLAARYLGDAGRWREIATANGLRYPYISDDPLVQYGPRLAVYQLPDAVNIGQRLIPLPGAELALIRPGVRFVVSRVDEYGTTTTDASLVDAYDGNSLTLAEPLAAPYPAGSQIEVYIPPGEIVGRVARPGEALIIPDAVDQATAAEQAEDDRFGRDLAVDEAGLLRLTTIGDLAVVAGVANLAQQLRHRLQTPRGALARHGAYGCDMHAYIGQASGPTLVVLIQAAIAQALIDDPRVANVESVSVAQLGERLEAVVQVTAQSERVALTIGVDAL